MIDSYSNLRMIVLS